MMICIALSVFISLDYSDLDLLFPPTSVSGSAKLKPRQGDLRLHLAFITCVTVNNAHFLAQINEPESNTMDNFSTSMIHTFFRSLQELIGVT